MAKKNDNYQDEYQEVLKGLFDLIKEHAQDAFFQEHHIELKKISKYEDPDDYLVYLEGSAGGYPPKACKSKKDYEERLKTGKIQKINDGTIADRLSDWEDGNL